MTKWLGLAATQIGKFREKVGAPVAASTLTTFFLFLQDDEPPLWEVIGRILKAAGEILFHWPEGVPVNGVSIILQILKAADLLDVGAKFEEFILTITQAPPLQDTIFGYIILAAMGPAWALFLFHSARWYRSYRKKLQEPGGEEQVWSDQAEILSPPAWFVQRFLLMFGILGALTAISIGPQLLVNITWNAMNAIVQVFYTGSGNTIGGVFVELLSRMAEAGVLEFLLSFCIVFGGGALLLATYGVRLLRFVWGHVLFAWRSPRTAAGERHVTLLEPARMWAERGVELLLTAVFILLGPLLLWLIPGLVGLPIAAGLFIVLWAAWKFPKEVTENWQDYYDRFGNWFQGGVFTPDEGPKPPPPPKRPGLASRLGGVAVDLAKQDPNYADAVRAVEFIQGSRRSGVKQAAMDSGEDYVRGRAGLSSASRQPAHNPRKDLVDRIPKKLYRRRNTLDRDQTLNDAMFAYLVDTYARSKPMRALDDLIVQASWEVKGLRSRNEPSFHSLASRGGELKHAAEVEKGDYEP